MVIIVVSVIAILFTLIAKVEAIITSVSSVAIYLGYALVIIAGMINRRGLRNPQGSFSLNRWHMPVSVAALVWLAVAIVALTLPAPGHDAAYVFFAVIGLGVIWYLLYVRRLPDQDQAAATRATTVASTADGAGVAGMDSPDTDA